MSDKPPCKFVSGGGTDDTVCGHPLSRFFSIDGDGEIIGDDLCHGCPCHEPAQEQPATCKATTLAGPDRKFRACEREQGHAGPHQATLCGKSWVWVDEPATGAECQHGHLARKCVHCELIAAEARVAELEREVATLATIREWAQTVEPEDGAWDRGYQAARRWVAMFFKPPPGKSGQVHDKP